MSVYSATTVRFWHIPRRETVVAYGAHLTVEHSFITVSAKKPDPLIYNTARERLGLSEGQCIVVEDSLVGLRAAVRANMKCIITYTSSTEDQDFYGEGAVATVPDLASRKVTLDSIFGPLRMHGTDAEILVGLKDEQKNNVQ